MGAPPRNGRMAIPSRLGDRLDVDLDVDVLADEHAPRLERLVPLQPVLPAVDASLRGERDALIAPRVLAAAELLDIELHGLCHPADRQVARDHVPLVARLLDLRALESELRKLLRLEEIRRPEV